MGVSVEVKCKDCDYNGWFLIGAGMRSNPYDMGKYNYGEMTTEHKTIVRGITGETKGKVLYGEECLFKCNICHNLETHYYYEIIIAGDKLTPTYQCKSCRNKLVQLNSNWKYARYTGEPAFSFSKDGCENIELRCPKCKNTNIEYNLGGLEWD